MTYITDETSVEDSQPRELWTIKVGDDLTYRVTSGKYDIVYSGNTYTAFPLIRGEQMIATTSGEATMELSLPLTHPVSTRTLQSGVPPDDIYVILDRLQLRSFTVDRQWRGLVRSVQIDGHVMKFGIPSAMQLSLKKKLPTFPVTKKCPFVLYGNSCGVRDNLFAQVSDVLAFSDKHVYVSALPVFSTDGSKWANGGDVKHERTGVSRSILSYQLWPDGSWKFELQAPILEMRKGDYLIIRAGCDHTMNDCSTKFSNRGRYGGLPELPTKNLFYAGNNIYWRNS